LAVSAVRDDPHSQLLKGSNTYFAATLITYVISAPKIAPCVFKLLRMTRFFARVFLSRDIPSVTNAEQFQGVRLLNRYRDNSSSIIALTPSVHGSHCPRNQKENLIMKYLLVLTFALAMPIFFRTAEA